MSMIKYYTWKVLSSDGLLKELPTQGPYYDEVTLNDLFGTEEEAVEALERFKAMFEYGVPSECVLLTVYRSY